jgi:hypothetical protein
VEILKQLHEAMHRKVAELWPDDWILHHDNAPAHKALSVKQFLNQKLIIKTKHPPYSQHLAPNDFLLFEKIKFALKGQRFQDTEDISHPKKSYDGTENYSTTGVPKMSPTVAASLG